MKQISESFNTVLRSKTIEQLQTRLENCIDMIQRNRAIDAEWVLEMLFLHLRDTIQWPEEKRPYYIVDGANGLLLYLYLYWVDSIEHLREFVKHLKRFDLPESERMTGDEVSRIFSVVDEKFPYTKHVIGDKPLYIISMDYSHETCNSTYFHQRLGNQTFDAILLTHSKKDFFCKQQYSFLHEMGYAVHSRLTQDSRKTPLSFETIWNRVYPEGTKKPSVEHFGECFATAACYSTELEKYDPYKYNSEKSKRQLYFYMKMLIDTYDKNPMGQLSYDELIAAYTKANRTKKR